MEGEVPAAADEAAVVVATAAETEAAWKASARERHQMTHYLLYE